VLEEGVGGGATIIFLLGTAMGDLGVADAGLVQARYTTRLALAGLEALLGRRFTTEEGQ
jgi:hypothetical protein